MVRRNSFRLPGHPVSVGLARRRVRDHLAAWGHDPRDRTLEHAVLLVSELATNAVRHGSSARAGFEVAVTALADGSCLVEVSDGSRSEPRPGRAAEDEETGRGLHLVEHLATAWGV
ncbi:ATP-binding protein [Streptomyces sp. NPDC051041]|uniref:ATP-binding protein n=1 Tax=Streptomyces sp. NPDC051041 TaxID=3365640 RepID=UPI0037A75590